MRAFVGLLALTVVAGCRGGDSDQPPVHLIRNMFTQEKGKAYRQDTTGVFADGRMMRTPVEGTVAVGELREDALFYEGLALPTDADGGTITVLADGGVPGLEATKKFPEQMKLADGGISDETRDHGRIRYNIYCAPCHGINGDGQGAVAMRPDGGTRGLLVPPPAMNSDRVKTLVVGKIFQAMTNGVNADNMPSYAAQIPVADRWAIATYVRKLGNVGDEGGEAPAAGDPTKVSLANGTLLYKARICNTCHSIDGTKIVGPSFKGLYGSTASTDKGDVKVDDDYIRESIREPLAKVVTGFPPAMPKQEYTPQEIESLILFIKEQK